MKNLILFFWVSILLILLSCASDKDSADLTVMDLHFDLVKKLEYEYLGHASLLDYDPAFGIYFLWDFQRNEVIIANDEQILIQKNLAEEGKDSYGGYLNGAKFWNDKLLIFQNQYYYIYDLELNLMERVELPFSPVMAARGPLSNNIVEGNYLVYYGDTGNDSKSIEAPKDPVIIWNLENKRLHGTISTPEDIAQVWDHVGYSAKPVKFAYNEGKLAILYPYHPEVFIVDISSLKIVDSVPLNGSNWKDPKIIKRTDEDRMGTMFDNLTYHTNTFVHFDEDMLLAIYESGLPRDEVDALPRDVIGGWFNLEREYRKPSAVALLNGEKVAETDYPWGIPIWAGGYRISTFPLEEGYKDVEEDFIRFYFYKPVLKPIDASL